MKEYNEREWLYDQYWNQEKSTYQIAKECGVCDETIRKRLKGFAISRRTKSESMKVRMSREEERKKLSKSKKGKKRQPFSREWRERLSKAHRGENHHNWKGGSYVTIHRYIKRLKPKPLNGKCENCNKEVKRLELTFNHFHKDTDPIYYTLNPDDYTWRCAGYGGCHRKYDKQFKSKNQTI